MKLKKCRFIFALKFALKFHVYEKERYISRELIAATSDYTMPFQEYFIPSMFLQSQAKPI